ncbi:MAG: hypothetical protein L0Z53_24920 [Acidobacteriales bacterium]|nr:hypothetical protein [Terriglobales bacterium]
MMLSLGTGHGEAAIGPIDVSPPQPQQLRWHAQTTEARQREHEPPFRIGAGFQHLAGFFACNEIEPLRVGFEDRCQVGKRIFGNQTTTNGCRKQLLGKAAASPNGVLCQALVQQVQPPAVCIAGRDVPQWLRVAKILDQVSPSAIVHRARARLHVGTAAGVVIDKGGQRRPFASLDKSNSREFLPQFVVCVGQPLDCFATWGRAGEHCRFQVFNLDLHNFGLFH